MKSKENTGKNYLNTGQAVSCVLIAYANIWGEGGSSVGISR